MKWLIIFLCFANSMALAKTTCREVLGSLHCDDGTMIRKDGLGNIHLEDSYIYQKRSDQPTTSSPQPNDLYLHSNYSNYRSSPSPFPVTKPFGGIFVLCGLITVLLAPYDDQKLLGWLGVGGGIILWNLE